MERTGVICVIAEMGATRYAATYLLGLTWEDPFRGVPWNYVERCEVALTAYENVGELPPGWIMPPVRDEVRTSRRNHSTPRNPVWGKNSSRSLP